VPRAVLEDPEGGPYAAAGTLRIDVTGASLRLSAAQNARVVRRVLLTLSRFGPRVHRVSVRVSELASPLGGMDRRCRMRAWLQAGDGIGVEVINGQIDAAVSRAATRLAGRVARALDGDAAHALAGDELRASGRLSPGTPFRRRRRLAVGPRRRE